MLRRQLRSLQRNMKQQKRKKLIIYSVFAWVPFCLLLFVVLWILFLAYRIIFDRISEIDVGLMVMNVTLIDNSINTIIHKNKNNIMINSSILVEIKNMYI